MKYNSGEYGSYPTDHEVPPAALLPDAGSPTPPRAAGLASPAELFEGVDSGVGSYAECPGIVNDL